MRIKREDEGIHEGDLTPMIDMTFQLIAFFMVLINFTQTESHEEIQLPKSVLAKPPEQPLEEPIMLNLTVEGKVIYGGRKIDLDRLGDYLTAEATSLTLNNKPIGEATIVIRADQFAEAGTVQDLIQVCQEHRFEKFALRAEEDLENR